MVVASAQSAIDIAKDIMARHPDYTAGGDHTVVFVYERLGLGIPAGDVLDEVLSGPPGYRNWINLLWVTGYRVGLGAHFQLASVGPIVQTDAAEAVPTWRFSPTFAGADMERLIEAVHMRQYLLLHQGIGLTAPGKPMILHTNGGEHFTDHPDFGVVPGALRYIDLRKWEGETRNFGESDMGDIA
ncbi:hypothetical protein DBA20_21835 [Pandoraea capi]|nr:hypothetical protein [Pandoraea sp. LA3]MDN4585620.1 hypothetical protein [Pandoraea capi]